MKLTVLMENEALRPEFCCAFRRLAPLLGGQLHRIRAGSVLKL